MNEIFDENNKAVKPDPTKAAIYVRMSTDHQKYSTENQEATIREYADKKNLEIINTYADHGKSGLKIEGRDALRRLIEDVENKRAEFGTILVLDVTRWDAFKMRMKVLIMSISVGVRVLRSNMLLNSLKMMEAQLRRSSKVLSVRWRVNIVASYRVKYLPVSVA